MNKKQISDVVVAEDFYAWIAKKLTELRWSQQKTQRAVSKAAGINQTRVSEFENGKRKLDLDDIERIANVLGVSMRIDFVPIAPEAQFMDDISGSALMSARP